jgi:predicted nucleotidyltransferase
MIAVINFNIRYCIIFLEKEKMDPLFSVPPIHLRHRIPSQAIQQLVEKITENFHPQKIILFGSYAYGNPQPESDVDLLVIMDTPLKESQQALEIRKALHIFFGLDLIVRTPQNMEERLRWGDSFLKEIITKGKVLYESSYY